MSSYIGKHASFYDLIYSNKDYQTESEFIHQLITKYGQNNSKSMLELACGTGNHAFFLEKKGYQIIATDYSEEMIEQAKAKIRIHSSSIDFKRMDMRNFEIPNKFDSIICLFDSIGYLLKNEDIQSVFSSIRDCLNPGGVFIMEFWHAAAMLKGYDPVRVKRWEREDSSILRISETEIDYPNQISSVHYSIYQHFKDGTYKQLEELQQNRFFLVQEMSALLKSSGLFMLKNFPGYSWHGQINENIWHVISVIKNCSEQK